VVQVEELVLVDQVVLQEVREIHLLFLLLKEIMVDLLLHPMEIEEEVVVVEQVLTVELQALVQVVQVELVLIFQIVFLVQQPQVMEQQVL
jgi:hypothetical protein